MPKEIPSRALIKSFRCDGKEKVKLKDYTTRVTKNLPKREVAETGLVNMQQTLNSLQQKLYAQSTQSILVVLQAMDTGGKDGLIRHVFGPLNPQGVRVSCFKKPTAEEQSHGYLWRIHKEVPAQGMIRVFNRSHYEDVLIARVHELVPSATIKKRYGHINDFERYLTDCGVVVIKLFLHISYGEQHERLTARLARPEKHWKFDPADIAERLLWTDYQDAYETMLNKCSTSAAPWYIIPADRKWYRNWLVTGILLQHMQKMKLDFPPPLPDIENITIPQ